jgi:cysteine-rich repeat protein
VWLDPGEECDPESEPWKSKGGCSNICTLLGSKKDAQSEPICGDGKLEWSEQCDPSVAPWTTSGVCGDNCLLDGASHRGTTSSLCGNSLKEIGEDCDDGNLTDQDGCSNVCLNEGSLGSAVCGDGVVSSSASDGFSWVFKTGLTADVCVVDHIEVLPKEYNASYIGEKYNTFVQPYSSSDECNTKGEKLNSEDSRYQWDWDPRDGGSLRNLFSADPYEDVDPKVGILNVDPSLMSFQEEMQVLGESSLDAEKKQNTIVASQIKEDARDAILCTEKGISSSCY